MGVRGPSTRAVVTAVHLQGAVSEAEQPGLESALCYKIPGCCWCFVFRLNHGVMTLATVCVLFCFQFARMRDRQTVIFHPLVYFSIALSTQSWARLKSRVWNSVRVLPPGWQGCIPLSPHLLLPRVCMSRKLDLEVEELGLKPDTLIWNCRYPKWSLKPVGQVPTPSAEFLNSSTLDKKGEEDATLYFR